MSQLQQKTFNRTSQPLIQSKKKQTHIILGFTGAAKSTWLEKILVYLHKKGQTAFDGFAGDLFENMCYPLTINCQNDQDPDNPCNCHDLDSDKDRIPITIFCQHDIVFTDDYGNETEDPIKFWNENRFSRWEYKKYYLQDHLDEYPGFIQEYSRTNPPMKPQGKPRVPWLRFIKLPPAQKVSAGHGIFEKENNQKIKDIFMAEMKKARDERRIVVFNPGMFPNEFLRFMSLNIMVRSIRDTKSTVFVPATEVEIGKPRSEWTDWELNKDRMFMAMRELGELLNQEMKSDDSGLSSLVKKAILNYIRKARQYDVGFIGDAQRNDDMFKGIRVHGDVFWIKYGPQWLFGEAWEWLFKYINEKRQKILESTNWNFDLANEKWPRIEDLGPNWAYAVRKEANKPELVETPMPNHHHWRPSDNFNKITGIHWKFTNQPTRDSDGKPVVEINDNTIEMMQVILNPTDAIRKKWNKDYNIKIKKKPSWDEAFVLYQHYVKEKLIQTAKVRNSKDALRIWLGRQKTA